MREVFESVAQSGFGAVSEGRSVESIAFSGHRIFAGASDGAILQAEMKPEAPQYQNSPHVFCAGLQDLRSPGRDRRGASCLKVVESWRVLLCIVESTLHVYNLHALGTQAPQGLKETKGCLMYSVSSKANILCVISKRKLSFYSFMGKKGDFAHRGDLALPETPRVVYCCEHGVVVGFRKSFDYIDFETSQQTRLIGGDKDREGKCTITDLPSTEFRGGCLLLGRQLQGKLLDKSSLPRALEEGEGGGADGDNDPSTGGSSSSSARDKSANSGHSAAALGSAVPLDGRLVGVGGVHGAPRVVDVLEWSAVPISVTTVGPFIVSLLLSDRLQIHDLVSLSNLQEVALHHLSPASSLHTTLGVSASALSALGGDVHADLTTRMVIMQEENPPADKTSGLTPPPRIYAMCLTAHQKGMSGSRIAGPFSSLVGGGVSVASNIFKGTGGHSGLGVGDGSGTKGAQKSSGGGGVGGNVDSGVLCVVRMIPLFRQVAALMQSSSFEAAISSSVLGASDARTRPTLTATHEGAADPTLSLVDIRRQYAQALHSRGDFEGSVEQHIQAHTPALQVLSRYPDFLPSSLRAALEAKGLAYKDPAAEHDGDTKMLGGVLSRAATAVVEFCEHFRRTFKENSSNDRGSGGNKEDATREFWSRSAVDSAYLCALLSCSPPRRPTILALVSAPNHCFIDACSVSLAAQGHMFIESLLWLYRSRGEHRRVITNLNESRCVPSVSAAQGGPGSLTPDTKASRNPSTGNRSPGGGVGRMRGKWDREAFYSWTGSYLMSLWNGSAIDPNQLEPGLTSPAAKTQGPAAWPTMVLSSLPSLMEYDAREAMAVLCSLRRTAAWMTGSTATVDGTVYSFASMQVVTDVLAVLDACVPYKGAKSAVSHLMGANSSESDRRRILVELAVRGSATTATAVPGIMTRGGPGSADRGRTISITQSRTPFTTMSPCLDDDATEGNGLGGISAARATYPLTDGAALSLTFLEWLLLESPYHVKAVPLQAHASGSQLSQQLQQMSMDGRKEDRKNGENAGAAHAGEEAGLGIARDLANIYVRRLLEAVTQLEADVNGDAGDGSQDSPTRGTLGGAGSGQGQSGQGIIHRTDSIACVLFKIYRCKLQFFLSTTRAYDASLALQLLPTHYLQECALILGRLGRHREALVIYYSRAANLLQAVEYCDMVWDRVVLGEGTPPHGLGLVSSNVLSSDEECEHFVYLYLIETILNPDNKVPNVTDVTESTESGGDHAAKLPVRVHVAVALAETFFQRLDASVFLAMVQRAVGENAAQQTLLCSRLNRFVLLVQEYKLAATRNLQVVHHLQRTREVALRIGQKK